MGDSSQGLIAWSRRYSLCFLTIMPRKGKRSRGGRNGSATTTVPRTNRVIDLTNFNARRLFRIVQEVTLNESLAVEVTNRGFNGLPAVGDFLGEFMATRLTRLEIWFDQRGSASTGAIPRCGAFLLPGLVSDYDFSFPSGKPGTGSYAGRGLNQINPSKPLILRVGPEFGAGRFPTPVTEGPGTQTSVLFLDSNGYKGTVRVISHVETLGYPFSLIASSTSSSSSSPPDAESSPSSVDGDDPHNGCSLACGG